MTELTESDEGKRVVGKDGETIGIVTNVQHGSASVDPDPGITDRIKSRLGWEDPNESDYMLHADRIETVTDDEIRLK